MFLLAEESNGRGKSTTKWQLMLPKLVPVNLARVQDAPTIVSHVTAYDTKVEKILDVLIYCPGLWKSFGMEVEGFWYGSCGVSVKW